MVAAIIYIPQGKQKQRHRKQSKSNEATFTFLVESSSIEAAVEVAPQTMVVLEFHIPESREAGFFC